MTPAVTSPVAFVFPGQGSQRIGMLDALPDGALSRELLDSASEASGIDLAAVASNGPDADLADTRAAQPLLYLVGVAWASALADAGIRPAMVAGHSLGEITALAVAGVFDVATGLHLVIERSRAMADAAAGAPGTMAAVIGMDTDTVTDLVEPIAGVWVANDNAPGQIVLTGTHIGIEAATRALTEAGARKIVPLAVAGPFHSPLMAPASERFLQIIESTTLAPARVPVVQNTSAAPSSDPAFIKERLSAQITSPVRWTETMTAIRDAGIGLLVEVGPGAVLSGLARRMDGLAAFSVESAGIDRIREEIGA